MHTMWLVLGGMFLLCCGGGATSLVLMLVPGAAGESLTTIDAADVDWSAPESIEQRRDDLVAGFGAEDVGVTGPTLRGIERFLDEYVEICGSGDELRHRELIDGPRLFTQYQRYEITPASNYVMARLLAREFAEAMTIPGEWRRYSLLHADLSPSESEAKLHVVLWDETDTGFEYRLWLIRHDGRWQLYDSDFCQYNLRESQRFAHFSAYQDTAGYQGYAAAGELIQRADEQQALGEYDEARASLARAGGSIVHPQLLDNFRLEMAYAYTRIGDYPRALAWCRKVEDTAAVPGAIYGQLLVRDEFDQPRRVLELAGEYEQLIGGGPNVAHYKAVALQTLGQDREAAEQWRRYLEVDPNNIAALGALTEILPDDEMQKLLTHVRRTEEPLQTAESLLYRGKDSAHVALTSLIEELAPKSKLLREARARGLYDQEKYELAAAIYLDLYEKEQDEDARSEWLRERLHCLLAGGKVYEAYSTSPDADAAFDFLTDAFDEGDYVIPTDVFARVLAEQREKNPKTPWLAYYEVDLLLRQEQYELAAQRAAEVASESEDEYERDSLRSLRQAALTNLGRHVEAYQTLEPKDEVFQRLAQSLRWQGAGAKLRELLVARRQDASEDPWLHFYEGITCRMEGDHQQAEQCFLRATNNAGEEESIVSRCIEERIELALEAGDVVTLYKSLDDAEEHFATIARQLLDERRVEELKQLLDHQRTAGSEVAVVEHYQVLLDFQQEKYEEIIARYGDWPHEVQDAVIVEPAEEIAETVVRCLLRTGKIEQAVTLARRLDDEYGIVKPLLLASARQGDHQQVVFSLEDFAASHGEYSLRDVYFDQDIGKQLRDDRFQDLRLRFPGSIELRSAEEDVTILLAKPVELDAEILTTLLTGAAAGGVKVSPLPSAASEPDLQAFLVLADKERLVVVYAPSPYIDEASLPEFEIQNPDLRQSLRSHEAWIHVEAVSRGDSPTTNQCLRRVSAALLNEPDASAVYFGSPNRLLSADEARQALAADKVQRFLKRHGEFVYLYRTATASEDDGDLESNDFSQRLEKASEKFQAGPAGVEFRVQVKVHLGHASESLWIEVENATSQYYGGYEYTGRLAEASQIDPRYTAGEPVSVSDYEVVDWTYSDGQSTSRGRTDSNPSNSP